MPSGPSISSPSVHPSIHLPIHPSTHTHRLKNEEQDAEKHVPTWYKSLHMRRGSGVKRRCAASPLWMASYPFLC